MASLFEQDLARSGISPETAYAAGIYEVANAKDEVLPEFKAVPSIVFPYFDPRNRDEVMRFERDGRTEEFARVRYMRVLGKQRRYDQPRQSGIMAYFPRILDWPSIIANPNVPIIITEGEKKALSLCAAGYPCIGLGGVDNFKSMGRLIASLECVNWGKRIVIILFDSDRAEKPQIRVAEDRLAQELSTQRGADMRIAQLPPGPDGIKMGVDDYLVAYGVGPLLEIIKQAMPIRKVDAAVRSLNSEVAWIERDGCLYDYDGDDMLSKSSFVEGSRHSIHKIAQASPNSNKVVTVSVAKEWLTHPEATRFWDVVFDPSTDERVIQRGNGLPNMNMWRGFQPIPGDVTPFLELNAHITQNMHPAQRDLPLKIMAYKAQNPGEKIPLAIAFVGAIQGSGKSLWCELMMDAFTPYVTTITSDVLKSEFNGWTERNMITFIDEAKPDEMRECSDKVKRLISGNTVRANEKYRKARDVPNHTLVLIASNYPEIAATERGDRRMVIVACPGAREKPFYDRIKHWREKEDGGLRLLNYLLTYDLQGWVPPARPPESQERIMARQESLTPIQQLADTMLNSDRNIIAMWAVDALRTAQQMQTNDNPSIAAHGRDASVWLSEMRIRPFYTPKEIAMLFPHLAETVLGGRGFTQQPANVLSRELRKAQIPYLLSADNPEGFIWQGKLAQFLIVTEHEAFRRPYTQHEFDEIVRHAPRLADLIKGSG